MIRLLSIPVGPCSAPYRVLVEITGVRIHATGPIPHVYSPPTAACHRADYPYPGRRPKPTDTRYTKGRDKGIDYESEAAHWDADLARRTVETRLKFDQMVDRQYRHATVAFGFGEQEMSIDTHATLDEIQAAICNASDDGTPVAIVEHDYSTAPA